MYLAEMTVSEPTANSFGLSDGCEYAGSQQKNTIVRSDKLGQTGRLNNFENTVSNNIIIQPLEE